VTLCPEDVHAIIKGIAGAMASITQIISSGCNRPQDTEPNITERVLLLNNCSNNSSNSNNKNKEF